MKRNSMLKILNPILGLNHSNRRSIMKERLKQTAATILKEIAVYRAVAADPRCPRLSRWLLGCAVAYALSPIDLIPDFIPIIGHLDDLLILPLLIWMAVRMVPAELIDHHRCSLEQQSPETIPPQTAHAHQQQREAARIRRRHEDR